MPHFEPLNARERLTFQLEDRHVHQHAATACVLEAGPLTREGGGVDIDRIREFVEARLLTVGRRQDHGVPLGPEAASRLASPVPPMHGRMPDPL